MATLSKRALQCTILVTCLACGGPKAFEVPRQPIPAAHFEALTSAPEGGGDLRKLNEERLGAAREQFKDLDSKHWQGSGPWWIRETARLVTWVDGQTVLIAVAEYVPETPGSAPQTQRRQAASDRAKAEAGRAFRTLAGKVALQKGASVSLSGEVKLKRVQVESYYELGDRTWALALCDRECLEANGRAVRVTLAGVALTPGVP